MREIKFRIWNSEEKRMMPFGEVVGCELGYLNGGRYGIPMQYTGLKDKNGKEIYEGDIVKSPDIDNQQVVSYEEIIASDDMTAPGIGFQFNANPSEMEIIGNIYENPELLK